jgi:hypothetical protein
VQKTQTSGRSARKAKAEQVRLRAAARLRDRRAEAQGAKEDTRC